MLTVYGSVLLPVNIVLRSCYVVAPKNLLVFLVVKMLKRGLLESCNNILKVQMVSKRGG